MMCFILPTCLGALWGDALGGYLYGGFVSRIILWHTTWFINSLAHSWGEQEFSAENTSRGNHIIALLTMGEGHHNYHHEFPRDYRNGILAIDYDPTKWLIIALSYFGDIIVQKFLSTWMLTGEFSDIDCEILDQN